MAGGGRGEQGKIKIQKISNSLLQSSNVYVNMCIQGAYLIYIRIIHIHKDLQAGQGFGGIP